MNKEVRAVKRGERGSKRGRDSQWHVAERQTDQNHAGLLGKSLSLSLSLTHTHSHAHTHTLTHTHTHLACGQSPQPPGGSNIPFLSALKRAISKLSLSSVDSLGTAGSQNPECSQTYESLFYFPFYALKTQGDIFGFVLHSFTLKRSRSDWREWRREWNPGRCRQDEMRWNFIDPREEKFRCSSSTGTEIITDKLRKVQR